MRGSDGGEGVTDFEGGRVNTLRIRGRLSRVTSCSMMMCGWSKRI